MTVTIPRSFSFLLPAQGFVAAVVIYASIYVFAVGTIPFILSVVAAGVHFLLGLYICFTGNRPGMHHLYVIPATLVACAGVWCGALYYFARALEVLLGPLGIIIGEGPPGQPLYATWVKVGIATAALNVVLDFALLGTFLMSALRQSSRRSQPPPAAQVPAQTVNTQWQQQQQHYQPQPQHTYQHQAFSPQPIPPPPSFSPAASDYKAVGTPPPAATRHSQASPPAYDSRNRIDVIRRLCSLQHPDGHWDYTPELAELVKLWGGRELMAPAHGVTALTNACLMDLCNYVWTAQRDGREHSALSGPELIGLQAVNWDLGWANNALDRATAWMSGFR